MRKFLPHTGSNFLYTSSYQHQVGRCHKKFILNISYEKAKNHKEKKGRRKPDPMPDNHKNGFDVETCTTENMVYIGIKT